ncbi:MAG: DUF4258 domain-containing protein [Acidobacteriota bacterium]
MELIKGAARIGKIVFRYHALKELRAESFTTADAVHCILFGEIVEDQIDRNGDLKFVIYGESVAKDEMGVITKWDDDRRVVVITAFQLEITDYD